MTSPLNLRSCIKTKAKQVNQGQTGERSCGPAAATAATVAGQEEGWGMLVTEPRRQQAELWQAGRTLEYTLDIFFSGNAKSAQTLQCVQGILFKTTDAV